MKSIIKSILVLASMLAALPVGVASGAERHPNIVIILADDLGYGDVGCYNSESKVATANLDRLAEQGMRFTDAHSPATVCTPTRYSLLTGRMAFRTGKSGVFTGVGGPNMIEPERLTLASMLRQQGYATAMFGKWHVGLTFLDKNGERVKKNGNDGVREIDFDRAIPDAPIYRGFDHFYGTACCPTTDWLYAYIDGDRIPVPPSMTETRDRKKLPEHPYSGDCRGGLIAPNFDLEKVDLVFLEKSREFLTQHVAKNSDQPFFLFHSMQAVHLPSFPADEFKGKSGAGPHGDFIFEADWVVGQLMETLEKLDIAKDTLVMFASDNGPETTSVIHMRGAHQHDGARPWRGVKRDQWEGGHRTPFIVRWPGTVKPRSVCDDLFSLTDVFATCAAIVDFPLEDRIAEDSFNQLPTLLSKNGDSPVRDFLLQQTWGRRHLSLRKGRWKLLDHKGSGGNNYEKNKRLAPFAIEDTDPDAAGQLYDLQSDPGETKNVYSSHADEVRALKQLLDDFVERGRSVPLR